MESTRSWRDSFSLVLDPGIKCGFPHLQTRAGTVAGYANGDKFEDMYELIVFIHILSAMVWVGGGLFAQFTIAHLRSNGGDSAVAEYLIGLEWAENRVFGLSSGLVFLTGLTMVILSEAWAFSQLWVIVALALFIVDSAIQGIMGGRALKDLRAAAESESSGIAGPLKRVMTVNNVDTVLVLVILSMMVFKPGI